MEGLSDTLDVQQVIEVTATRVARGYSDIVERDDLIQEGWVWVLSNETEVNKFKSNPNAGGGAHSLGQRLNRAMERYCRAEKSARGGYEVEDDVYFSPALIGLVLPSVLKDDPVPPVQQGERIANTSDPAEGGNWLATYLDVKQAWLKADLTDQQRQLLIDYHLDDLSQLELATQLGISQQAVSKRLSQAHGKMIEVLGGYRPDDYDEPASHPGAKGNQPGAVSAAIN